MSQMTRLIRFVRHWHARAGFVSALFFMLLALTGLLLNHTDRLQLAHREIQSPWLMEWYGLKAEVPEQGYLTAHGYAICNAQDCMVNGQKLQGVSERLLGMIELQETYYLATKTSIHLYDKDLRKIERLTGSSLPETTIERIGHDHENLLVEGHGSVYSSRDGLTWESHAGHDAEWSVAVPLPGDKAEAARKALAPGLPLERVILDLHSGRIFGRFGPLLMDIAAIALIVLSFSGSWIYLRSIRTTHRNRQG